MEYRRGVHVISELHKKLERIVLVDTIGGARNDDAFIILFLNMNEFRKRMFMVSVTEKYGERLEKRRRDPQQS